MESYFFIFALVYSFGFLLQKFYQRLCFISFALSYSYHFLSSFLSYITSFITFVSLCLYHFHSTHSAFSMVPVSSVLFVIYYLFRDVYLFLLYISWILPVIVSPSPIVWSLFSPTLFAFDLWFSWRHWYHNFCF